YHAEIPDSFDGFRIAFASDFHYKSKYKEKALNSTVELLHRLQPDVLLMGGDYQEGCEYVEELFARLGEIKPRFGTIGVMGNNDYERCHEEIVTAMKRNGMRVLEHELDTLATNGEQIIVAGVRNPFDLTANGVSPTLSLNPKDFVILLTHTPDYAEDVDIKNTDLVLAGHTHGGQITLFGLYAPATGSHYGQRFVKGKQMTSEGIPIIITNGLGTSRKNIRLFAPSEIVMIVLHQQKAK
ncbi:MAG: metallophosphoesterase, partial [Bacteroidaceae bacterium]